MRRKIFCDAKMEGKYFGNQGWEGKYFVILCWRENIFEIRVRRKIFWIRSWKESILEIGVRRKIFWIQSWKENTLEIENEKENTLWWEAGRKYILEIGEGKYCGFRPGRKIFWRSRMRRITLCDEKLEGKYSGNPSEKENISWFSAGRKIFLKSEWEGKYFGFGARRKIVLKSEWKGQYFGFEARRKIYLKSEWEGKYFGFEAIRKLFWKSRGETKLSLTCHHSHGVKVTSFRSDPVTFQN